MTKDQIQTYSYCNSHLKKIESFKEKMPFNIQMYGCGSHVPNIEHTLDKIHANMYKEVFLAMEKAEKQIQEIIDKA